MESKSPFGTNFKEKLLFVPNADTDPKVEHEISEPALFRFLLKEETIKAQAETLSGIDKLSEIKEVETHQSSMGWVTDRLSKDAVHVFIVFKTSGEDEDYWWSLEKNTKYIVMQRSPKKNDVKEKLNGKERKRVQPIAVDLKGKGTIKDLFAILWVYEVIPEKYHIKYSNCQSLVTLVSKKITEIGYVYKGYFPYSPQENHRNINLLNKSKGHPLFNLIYYEEPDLFDILMESGEYDINDTFTDHRITPLHLAIAISSPEMVRHLLEKWKANPTIRDGRGRTALHLAALYAQGNVEKIIDLLLEHIKVDERDSYYGRTALHYAICACNSIAVKYLIDKGAYLDIYDKDGQSPLHLAACPKKGTEIVDLILKAKKAKRNNEGIDDVHSELGITALHMAVTASNETTGEYLIKRGADINYRDKCGRTPLHWAAAFAQDMKIIDLLLENIKKEEIEKPYIYNENIFDCAEKNKNGLEQEIIGRLRTKGISGKKRDPTSSINMEDESNKKSDETSNEKTEKEIETIIQEKREEIFFFEKFREAKRIFNIGRQKKTLSADTEVNIILSLALARALEHIIIESDVEKIHNLKDEGIYISKVTWENGANALHVAAKWAKTTEMIDAIQETRYKKDIDLFDLFPKPEKVNIHRDKAGTAKLLRFDVNRKTNGGDNALTFLCQFYKQENLIDIIQLLIEKNIDVDCKNNDGWNALHFVCRHHPQSRLVDLVRLLVQHKIDKKVKTTGGEIGTARSFLLKRFKKEEIKDVLQILLDT